MKHVSGYRLRKLGKQLRSGDARGDEPMLSPTELDAFNAGYVRSPNNSMRWYPSGPGLPTMPVMFDVLIDDRECRPVILQIYLMRENGAIGPSPIGTVASFETWDQYMDYARRNGRISEPGLPAFSNGWD